MAANTLLQSLIDDTITLTKRPDLLAETKLAVKSATLKVHTTDYMQKDLKDHSIQFNTEEYFQEFEPKLLIPTWRALKYIRKVVLDSSSGNYIGANFLSIVTPESILDDYSVEKPDVAYGAGTVIKLKLSTKERRFLVGCYVYPTLVDESYESWIAREFPYAIIYDAAATVFKGIGFDEQAAQFRSDAALWFTIVKNSNVLVTGE